MQFSFQDFQCFVLLNNFPRHFVKNLDVLVNICFSCFTFSDNIHQTKIWCLPPTRDRENWNVKHCKELYYILKFPPKKSAFMFLFDLNLSRWQSVFLWSKPNWVKNFYCALFMNFQNLSNFELIPNCNTFLPPATPALCCVHNWWMGKGLSEEWGFIAENYIFMLNNIS